MKTKFIASALVVGFGLFTASVAIADMTREQVKAELADAKRSGDIVAQGERGFKLNELYPNSYPAKPVTATLTREQVKAELADAVRSGDILAIGGNQERKLNELYPSRYPTTDEMNPNRYSSYSNK